MPDLIDDALAMRASKVRKQRAYIAQLTGQKEMIGASLKLAQKQLEAELCYLDDLGIRREAGEMMLLPDEMKELALDLG